MASVNVIQARNNAVEFRGKITLHGAPYDPTEALYKQLIFRTQQGTFIRTASLVTDGTYWYLQYIQQPGTEDDKFHRKPGLHFWQGYIEFSSGQQFHTSIASYLVEGNLA